MKKLLLCLALVPMLSSCGVYSEGDRTGVVNKISKKGILFKTWEGELLMGGLRTKTNSDGNPTTVANIFVFSVTDEDVAKDLIAVAREGKMSTLVYDQYLIPSPLNRKTSYIIRKVE